MILPHSISWVSLRVLIRIDDSQELQTPAYATLRKEGIEQMCWWQEHSLNKVGMGGNKELPSRSRIKLC